MPDDSVNEAIRAAKHLDARQQLDLLSNLGVMKSFSRPRVSDDTAYSESHFKMLENVPSFPGRFGSKLSKGTVYPSLA